MTASLPKGSKVFELLEGGAAARKAGRRKLNVFARWAISIVADFLSTVRMSLRCILDKAERRRLERAG
jgi:hypothetical protein